MTSHPSLCRTLFAVLYTIASCCLTGCNAYMLQGKVVRGPESSIQLVYAGDERLDLPAVGNAEVRITRDPTNPNRHLVGQARSNPGGDFTIVMEEFGTGWMEEQWLVQGIGPGFQNAETMMELPSKNSKWRLLITLSPGLSEPLREDDLMEDLERFK